MINTPLDDDDVTLYIINGLSNDLKDISATVQTRDTPISFEELYEKLVEHEAFLRRYESPSNDSTFNANVANRSATGAAPTQNFNSNHCHNPTSNGSLASSPRRYGSSRNYKGKCQLCSQQDHSAHFCPLLRQQ